MKYTYKAFLASVGFAVLCSTPAAAVTVDLLILYDTYSSNYFNGQPATAMKSWVDQINVINQNSGVDIQWRLVGVERHEESNMYSNPSYVLSNIQSSTWVQQRRDALAADFVSQIHEYGGNGGAANVNTGINAAYAFSVVGPQAGPNGMAHFLGYNMGLGKSQRETKVSTRYSYGLGHGVDSVFTTIMASPTAYGNPTTVPKYSNPNISTCMNLPCGVAVGAPLEADAAQALNNVKTEIAAFYPRAVGVVYKDYSGVYEVRNKYTNQCLDLYQAKVADGAVIDQWGCNNAAAQSWIFTSLGSDVWRITAQSSNKCMDVANASTANYTLVHQWTCVGSASQKWHVLDNGDGSVRLLNYNSGKAAGVLDSAQGARIYQWDWSSSTRQRWILRRK